MTATRKRKPAAPKASPETVPDSPTVVLAAHASQPDWGKRILYLAVVVLVAYTLTAHRKPPAAVPDEPISGVYAQVAPLFPEGQDDTASLYAAYFAAQADKVQADQATIPDAVSIAARKNMGLVDNPDLSGVVSPLIAPYVPPAVTGPLPVDQIPGLVAVYREVSDACLKASAD